MKKVLLSLIIVFGVAMNGFSQTKKIAHRSHSGKDATLVMNDEDNFGLPPAKKDTNAKKPVTADTIVKQKNVVMNKKLKTTPNTKSKKKTKQK